MGAVQLQHHLPLRLGRGANWGALLKQRKKEVQDALVVTAQHLGGNRVVVVWAVTHCVM